MTPIDLDAAIAIALDAIFSDRLAMLAGAGLSMAPPSNLPSAWILAKNAKAEYDARYGRTRSPLPTNIEEQAEFFFQRDELATVYIRSLINDHVFSGNPNAGHSAIADLLLSGALRMAITTNVDSIIEIAGSHLLGRVQHGRRRARRRCSCAEDGAAAQSPWLLDDRSSKHRMGEGPARHRSSQDGN